MTIRKLVSRKLKKHCKIEKRNLIGTAELCYFIKQQISTAKLTRYGSLQTTSSPLGNLRFGTAKIKLFPSWLKIVQVLKIEPDDKKVFPHANKKTLSLLSVRNNMERLGISNQPKKLGISHVDQIKYSTAFIVKNSFPILDPLFKVFRKSISYAIFGKNFNF